MVEYPDVPFDVEQQWFKERERYPKDLDKLFPVKKEPRVRRPWWVYESPVEQLKSEVQMLSLSPDQCYRGLTDPLCVKKENKKPGKGN